MSGKEANSLDESHGRTDALNGLLTMAQSEAGGKMASEEIAAVFVGLAGWRSSVTHEPAIPTNPRSA